MRENKNFQIGNFNKAKKEFESRLSNNNLSIKDTLHITKQIESAKNYYEKLIPQNPGETYFPVIDNENSDDRVFTLRVVKSKNGLDTEIDFYKSWEYVKNLIAGFLHRKLNASDILSAVLDWKFERIGIEIVKPYNDFNLAVSEISGNSMQLAMGVAFVSFLLNEKIPQNYAFSGSLSENSGGLSIEEVESIERKQKIISEEKPEVTEFITFNNFNDFEKLIIEIFGNDYLEKIIENLKNNIPVSGIPVVSIEIIRNTRVYLSSQGNETNATIYRFNDINFPSNKLTVLNEFFEKLGRLTSDNIIILDNLRPNFATGMIMPKFINKISGFVALNYPPLESKVVGFEKSAIVIYKSRANKDVRVGEIIYYGEK